VPLTSPMATTSVPITYESELAMRRRAAQLSIVLWDPALRVDKRFNVASHSGNDRLDVALGEIHSNLPQSDEELCLGLGPLRGILNNLLDDSRPD